MRETMAVEGFYIFSPGRGISKVQFLNTFETTLVDFHEFNPNDNLGRFPLTFIAL